MKKFLGYGLALALVLSLCVSQAWARGGGHGGGHHGGGHHGGHHSGHHGHHSHHHTGHHDHHHSHHGYHHHSHWAHHNRPFSHGWYGNHGGAWGGGWGGGYGWGNPWGVANWGTTAAWLGMGAATTPLLGAYGTNNTTYVSENGTTDQPATTLTSDTSSTESPETLSATANELASNGTTEPGQDAKFLPLGVFSLAPQNQTEASALLQLAVSKEGVLRGTYFDLLSNEDHPIRGSVDKKTQRVAWTFGNKGKVTFQTALANLTEPSGKVSVHYENGQTREWVLARYEKEPTENDAKEEASEEADDKDDSNKEDDADSDKPGSDASDNENDKDDESEKDGDDDSEEEEKEAPTAGDKPFPTSPN